MTDSSLKICTVIGARPQFVKAGAVSNTLSEHSRCEEILIHTGQHYDFNMSEVFFREFSLTSPKYNLGVGSGSHAWQTAEMLRGLEDIFIRETPDVVLIYGDTNSTLAGAVAAAKLHLPVAHVEAGLRSFNRRMPEEVNRIVADSVSDLLLAPTELAYRQLLAEGQPAERVVLTGDVMFDASRMTADIARRTSTVLRDLKLVPKTYFLATVHRAENTDDSTRLRAIVRALGQVAREYPVVLPLHPRTRAALERFDLMEVASKSIIMIEPVGFIDMVRLEMDALAVASDSGGVQKEAFFFGVPCFVLRDETEWVELIQAGWNTLVPPGDPDVMAGTMLQLDQLHPTPIAPYGDGHASEVVVHELMTRYGRA